MAIWIALVVGALVGVAIHLIFAIGLVHALLDGMLLVPVGAILILSAISHLFAPEIMARELGWEPGGPFQRVVGFWNLSVGALALGAPLASEGYRLALTLAATGFWLGAATLHLSAWWYSPSGSEPARLATGTAELVLATSLVLLLAWTMAR